MIRQPEDTFTQGDQDAIGALIERTGLAPVLLAIVLACGERSEAAKTPEERERWDQWAADVASAHESISEDTRVEFARMAARMAGAT